MTSSGHMPFKIIEEIGRGGFAFVSRAEPVGGGDQVALKQPLPVPFAEERMRREISVQRELAGPHVMPIVDFDSDGPWFTMPVAEGNLLHLWRGGVLGTDPEALALEIVSALTEGLRDAHARGHVHRDLTPANVLALPDPNTASGRRWVVADFGLVRRPLGETTHRLTTGGGLGTPGFAAPESVMDDAHAVDQRADVYSVGRLLAWLLTDQLPMFFVPLLPSGRFRGLVADATDNDPSVRPPSLDILLERLQRIVNRPVVAPRPALRELLTQQPLNLEGVREIVRANMDNERLFIDDLAPMDRTAVRGWVDEAPAEAARTAIVMCRTLRTADWGRRNFDYANTPLGWAFAVLQRLVEIQDYDDAEDVGAAFFEVEEHWDRWSQLNATVAWLEKLTDPAGGAMARAIERAGAEEYYRRALSNRQLVSPDLSAIVEE